MKITKKEYSGFVQGVTNVVEKLIPTYILATSSYQTVFEVNTKIGKLTITLFNLDHNYGMSLYSIFCMFDEKEKFSKFESNRVNHYSGKWNFHHENKEAILRYFENELKEIVL